MFQSTQMFMCAKFGPKIVFWACAEAQKHGYLPYYQYNQVIVMLGMKIGVFEDEEHDKACFKALKPLYMPNLGQKLFFGRARGPKTWISGIFSVSSSYRYVGYENMGFQGRGTR